MNPKKKINHDQNSKSLKFNFIKLGSIVRFLERGLMPLAAPAQEVGLETAGREGSRSTMKIVFRL